MSHFVFRFQPILSVKKQLEDNKKNELGKAVKRFEEEKDELQRLETDRQECMDEMKQRASQSIDVKSLREYNSFLAHLRQSVQVQKQNVRCAEGNVESCRGELVKAVQERKTLDKLKERQLWEFTRHQLAKEQKFNDEIAGYAHNKKVAGE